MSCTTDLTQLSCFREHLKSVKISSFLLIVTLSVSLILSACVQRPQNADELREKTADATAQLKTNTKAIVQGVREGLTRDKAVDLNTATIDQLTTLPGVTRIRAGRVVANRPYDDPHDVVTKHVLSEQEYKRIKDRIITK
jgi:competence protein ComEA